MSCCRKADWTIVIAHVMTAWNATYWGEVLLHVKGQILPLSDFTLCELVPSNFTSHRHSTVVASPNGWIKAVFWELLMDWGVYCETARSLASLYWIVPSKAFLRPASKVARAGLWPDIITFSGDKWNCLRLQLPIAQIFQLWKIRRQRMKLI